MQQHIISCELPERNQRQCIGGKVAMAQHGPFSAPSGARCIKHHLDTPWIDLRTIEGMTQAEAAQVLGISEKAIETRLYRARAKLTELLRV